MTMRPQDAPPILTCTRGGALESAHRGWAVLWDQGVIRAHGDPNVQVFARSCTKPLQALAFVASGAADRFGCGSDEIALASASHNGSSAHRALTERMLGRAGLTANALQCGVAEPYGELDRCAFLRAGDVAAAPVHNCSGKHAAFLLTQIHLGGKPEEYLHQESPVQKLVRKLVCEVLELDVTHTPLSVDGCSAPTFRMPLLNLAKGFARLASPRLAPPSLGPHLKRIRDAITENPFLHSGNQRLCFAILSATGGAAIPKNGAEGVYAFGLRDRDAGFAIKVEDGNSRGHDLAVIHTLRELGAIPANLRDPRLDPFEDTIIKNAAGLPIGTQELQLNLRIVQ